MRQKLATNQINRRRNRLKEQRKKRFRTLFIGVLVILAFVFVIRPQLLKNNTAAADSASLISRDFINKREYGAVGTRPEHEEVAEKTFSMKEGFSDYLQAYKKVISEATIYKEKSTEGKAALQVKVGDYLRYYGSEDGWSKVSHKNIFGYIKNLNLQDTADNELVVKNGLLYVDNKNKIPSDFSTVFDVEAENSLLIALEAMRREGLEIGVGRRYTSFDDENKYITNNSGTYPNPDEYTSELRTGFAVELHSLKKDPRLEDNFFTTKEGKWIVNNIYKYGFVLRYPEGKEEITGFKGNQHIFRYVGVEQAKQMFESDLTMEEYFK